MNNLIYKKMSEVMKDIGAVTKDQKNQAQGFKFRGIDQFVNALYPALIKNGVFMTPRATSYTSEIKEVMRGSGKPGLDKHVSIMMEYDFYAEDGSKVTVGPIPAEGLDSGDKATNKALSAGLKYALIQTFSIPTEDMAEADLETPTIGNSISNRQVNNNYTPPKSAAPSAITPLKIETVNAVDPLPALTATATVPSAATTVAPMSNTSSFRKGGNKAAAKPAATTPAPTEGEWQ